MLTGGYERNTGIGLWHSPEHSEAGHAYSTRENIRPNFSNLRVAIANINSPYLGCCMQASLKGTDSDIGNANARSVKNEELVSRQAVLSFGDISLSAGKEKLLLRQISSFTQFNGLILLRVAQARSSGCQMGGRDSQYTGHSEQPNSKDQHTDCGKSLDGVVVSLSPRANREESGRIIVYGTVGFLIIVIGMFSLILRAIR